MTIADNLKAIALVKRLKLHNVTETTIEEKEVLAKFNGWGAMWKIFEEDHPQHEKVRSLLTPEEFLAASASTLNAHYTNLPIVDAVWKIVEYLGLDANVRILEPSCGIGYFISQKPDRGEWVGVELDPIAAAIAQYLNPQAKIYNQGFESLSFPDGYFDLAIGNVPFGSYSVYEARYDGLFIHNHFIMKSIDLVGEGGLIALITSTGTMDSPGNQEFRKELAKKARLIAAFRMPMGTMSNAKTAVTTDLLVFQKEDDRTQELNWLQTGEWKEMPINQYWLDNPEHLLGEICWDTLYNSNRAALKDTGIDVPQEMQELIKNFCPCYYQVERKEAIVIPPYLQNLPKGTYVKIEDKVYCREKNELVKVKKNDTDRVLANLEILEALEFLLDAQLRSSDFRVEVLRQELNDRYDSFVKQFGYLRGKQNEVMKCDPQYELLKSLEGENGKKTAIFFERTTKGYSPPDRCDSAKDALLHCLNALGKIDLEWITVRCN